MLSTPYTALIKALGKISVVLGEKESLIIETEKHLGVKREKEGKSIKEELEEIGDKLDFLNEQSQSR